MHHSINLWGLGLTGVPLSWFAKNSFIMAYVTAVSQCNRLVFYPIYELQVMLFHLITQNNYIVTETKFNENEFLGMEWLCFSTRVRNILIKISDNYEHKAIQKDLGTVRSPVLPQGLPRFSDFFRLSVGHLQKGPVMLRQRLLICGQTKWVSDRYLQLSKYEVIHDS